MKVRTCDVLVIGSGIAGLSFALKAVGRVVVVTKKERAASSTNWAQGGIAAVMGEEDEPALHLRDTLAAGAGLCHTEQAERLVREGPARVRDLIEWGVRFTAAEGRLSLGREGGHSRRRILHAADLTGREIERALLDALNARPEVEILEDHVAVDLLLAPDTRTSIRRCAGALVLDHHAGEATMFLSPVTLLATGGFGRAYRHTTNPDIATGDGVAMAGRAGATLANLEFVQFHPTALYPTEDRAILISEAVRGEGAVLRRLGGEPLMDGPRTLNPLSTRDVVARSIDLTLKETGEPHVLLDLSPLPGGHLEERFPFIFSECASRGIDIRREPIPVVPAAHYACGGVWTDMRGRTSIPGLYAAGETACTGVHGANRLASNSLLEAVVYSHRAAEDIRHHGRSVSLGAPSEPATGGGVVAGVGDRAQWRLQLNELRDLMWADAGIVRSDERLTRAEFRLLDLRQAVAADFRRVQLDADLLELRNLIDTALLVVRCALSRHESRGLHYNVDHPYKDNERYLRDTIVVPPGA